MNILILGYSKIVKKRVISALEKIATINCIDVASFTACQEIHKTGKIRNTYSDYDEALSKSESGIVYISTVNSDHMKWIVKCLKSGFHVMVDKPAVLSLIDAEYIVSLAQERNLLLSEAIVYKYHPQIGVIKDLFKTHNDIPQSISANFSVPGFEKGNFRYNLEKGGGAVYDLGPYALTLGELFFDVELISIEAFKLLEPNLKKDIETAFSVIIKYDDQNTLVGYFGFNTEYINQCFILGRFLSVNFGRVFTTDANDKNVINYKYKNQSQFIETNQADSFELYILDCLNSIKEKNIGTYANALLKQAKTISQLQKVIK